MFPMPTGVALMMTSKVELFQIGALDDARPRLVSQLLRRSGGAIQNVNFGAALLESEHCGAGSAPGAEHQNLAPSRS